MGTNPIAPRQKIGGARQLHSYSGIVDVARSLLLSDNERVTAVQVLCMLSPEKHTRILSDLRKQRDMVKIESLTFRPKDAEGKEMRERLASLKITISVISSSQDEN